MNRKMITLIIVILISFCFSSIVVADNITLDDNNTISPDNTADNNNTIDSNPADENQTTDENETDNESDGNYIIALGSGNDIWFSDGFRGFILDYSKSPASPGDEFERVSTSAAGNSVTLKRAVMECYKLGLSGQIGKIMADFIKSGSSGGKIGGAVASSHESASDHAVVKIDNHTGAVFDFEVLKSVSGNESNYFAYKISFTTINGDNDTNETDNLTNETNTTNLTSNLTNMTDFFDNETNATFLDDLYDFLLYVADLLYGSWEHIIDTLIHDILMFTIALEEMVKFFEEFMAEFQSLMNALEKLLNMLESVWKELDGILKLLCILLNAIQQLLNLIASILNFIAALISAIISLIQQILALLSALIGFILNLINQILLLIQAILDFLKSVGSALISIIENAAIIIIAFVIITIGTFVYNRIR